MFIIKAKLNSENRLVYLKDEQHSLTTWVDSLRRDIHCAIKWPVEDLGEYGSDSTENADKQLDDWMQKVSVEDGLKIVGWCPGRQRIHNGLMPVILIKLAPTWTDLSRPYKFNEQTV